MNLKLMRLICLLFVGKLTAQSAPPLSSFEPRIPDPWCWMTNLPDATLLSDMDIPGTHDSGALYDPPLLPDSAKCQDFGILDQLNMGVRYLDVRCRMIDNKFTIHHGAVYQNLNYDDVLTNCRDFLNANPAETIIMHVKPEHTAEGCTKTFEQIFADYVRLYPNLFFRPSNNRFTSLGETRGKIVLMRRFNWDQSKTPDVPKFGIDVNDWGDNLPYKNIDTGFRTEDGLVENILIQDVYNHTNSVTDKWGYVWDFHKKIMNKENFQRTFILNYISGNLRHWTNFTIPQIRDMANYTNGKVYDLVKHPMARYNKMGVIITDFMHPSLAKEIYKNNFWPNIYIGDWSRSVVIFGSAPSEADPGIRLFENSVTGDAYMLGDLQWYGYQDNTLSYLYREQACPPVRLFENPNLSGFTDTLYGYGYIDISGWWMNDRTSSIRFHKLATNPFARTNGESENYADSKIPNVDFKIYPNPTNGIFNIDFAGQLNISKIEVYDEKGSLILSKEMKDGVGNSIDITNQPKGMYLVKIHTKNETIVKKIVRS